MSFFSEETGQSARERFSEALAHIMLRWKDPTTHEEKKPGHPFFHTFASSLRYVETDGFGDESKGEKKDPLALAAVGFTGSSPVGRLYINPDNFLNLNIRQASGLVVHEILHIVYDHLHYEQQRTHPKIWNIATDCTINQQVEMMGYKLPEGKNILKEDPDHEVRCITPESLGDAFKCAPPKANENALFYFDWIVNKLKEQEKKKKPCGECGGTGNKPQDQNQKGKQPGGQDPGDDGDDGDQPGGKGQGEGDDGQGQGQGQNGQQPGQGSGKGQHDPNGQEPCDCCKGSGQEGGGGGTADSMLDELNGMTNHAHWDDMTPEEKEIVRRFEAQATQASKQHHDGMSGLPGDIAGAIAGKVKALEPEIDWQHELRRFVGGIGTCDLRIKKTRLNKYDMPGKHVMQPNAAIAVV